MSTVSRPTGKRLIAPPVQGISGTKPVAFAPGQGNVVDEAKDPKMRPK